MKKEIIICIVVILLIVILTMITEDYTKKTMDMLTIDLNKIREELCSNNDENLETIMNDIFDIFNDRKELLSCYIEHDELEKIELYLWEVSSSIETKEYSFGVQSIDSCNFVIAHIKDKYGLSLSNIF